jgi:hypothetical protein
MCHKPDSGEAAMERNGRCNSNQPKTNWVLSPASAWADLPLADAGERKCEGCHKTPAPRMRLLVYCRAPIKNLGLLRHYWLSIGKTMYLAIDAGTLARLAKRMKSVAESLFTM